MNSKRFGFRQITGSLLRHVPELHEIRTETLNLCLLHSEFRENEEEEKYESTNRM